MVAITSFFSIAIFIFFLWLFQIIPLGVKAISIAKKSFVILRDDNFNDLEREKLMQQSSIMLFGVFFSISFRSLLTLIISVAPIWISDKLGWCDSNDVITFLSRVDVIVITSAFLLIIYFVWQKYGL